MNKFYFLLLLCFFISCKEEQKNTLPEIKKVIPAIVITDAKTVDIDTALINAYNSKTLKQFYLSSDNKTIWGNLKKRTYILSQLKKSDELGLNPNDYRVKKMDVYEKQINKLNNKQLAEYDLLLTHNFEKYVTHLYEGKLNPKYLYRDWALVDKNLDINTALVKSFNHNTLDSLVENIQSKAQTYKQLLNALKLINNFPDDNIKTIEAAEKIVPKDTNTALINIKKRLLYWNDMSGNDSLTTIYDNKTVESVKKFQARHGLFPDGVIGASTIHALNFSKEKRKHQIIANLERWRWYPNEFSENYFIVNIPDYSLKVVENQDTTAVRNVVVGTSKRKTPILTSTLKTIVFNPTWTVPPTILKEDVVPAMKRNRNYLKNKNITIYDTAGHIVDPANWNINKPRSYRYIQSPGYNNSLGLIKIMFPNNYSVYLHDTNHRNYFERSNRSLSSGCVRVENPLELAQHILDDSKNWSKDKIDTIIARKKTTSIRITKKYKLYQWYWTAWSEKNQLIFRYDVYNLDEDLYSKLRN
ncbi:murein L,D-transpeptidase [Flavobacterium pectinovorum]|uniref:L,D-transpeptidase family protein n=1 Tax=Flavobacterium pectinovorum TaxID=29533 RepID=UPI001FAC6394|nr:L,D-transpeptidase family protein [Flavobacterium pectinovorum]MCI9843266.1 L,D-transpeptidase family protein [Flavobacterium pectinovorum]